MQLVIRDAAGLSRSRIYAAPTIGNRLAALGIAVGQIEVRPHTPEGAHTPDSATAQPAAQPGAAPAELAALHQRFAITHADRVSLSPGDPRWPELRPQFRRQHTHDDHELRVFLRGRGLFEVPLPDGGRAQLLCEAGDWVALPAGLAHAFDAGAQPNFDALRLFAVREGWVSTPTPQADQVTPPDLDAWLAERAFDTAPGLIATPRAPHPASALAA